MELLVSMVVLLIIMLLAFTMVGQMSAVYKKSSGQISAFQDARLAFETLTRHLSQATLNTYTDYDSPTNPQNYLRKSDLRFLSGPAGSAPMPGTSGCGQAVFFYGPDGYTSNPTSYGGMDSLLTTCGYFVQFTTNVVPPSFPSSAVINYRYRLMQLVVPTETANSVYPTPSNPPDAVTADWTAWFLSSNWFSKFTATGSTSLTPVADNVIALILRPQDPANASATPPTSPDINSNYTYDTTVGATTYPQPITANQLPPVIQVTMVVIDEGSARQLQNGSTVPPLISNALNGKFISTTNYSTDLANLQTTLGNAHIKFRVFSSGVPILETKWSK